MLEHQPRIDFGMVLSTSFGLEKFLEMTNALKQVEDKYKKPQFYQQNRHESSSGGNNPNKENQQPNDSTQSTRQPSQITRNTQIGNITVKQITTSLGPNLDQLVKALEDVLAAPQTMEEQNTPEQVSQTLAPSYDPDDYYVDLESSSRKHFNYICVITLGRTTGTTFPVAINSHMNINALYNTVATRS